jgi:hypothetical protein
MPAIPGFDSLAYPGDQVVIDLYNNTNIRWCGYYLAPTPNRSTSPWLAKRGNLTGLGLGLAPIYVGEQQFDPNRNFSTNLTLAKGTADGGSAVQIAGNEGFPVNSVIYLDVESGGPIQQAMFDYTGAWQTAVVNAGFRAGIYCSHLVANQFQTNATVAALYFWVFNMIDQGSNNGIYSNPFPTPSPVGCGFASAQMWQYAQGQMGTGITWPNGNLPNIDLDVSSVLDPSSPP